MLDALLQGIVEDSSEDRWHVLADYLEEYDDPRRAELLRLHRRMLATSCEPERHPQRESWQARMVTLLAEGIEPCVPRTTLLLGKRLKIPMTFSFIPPGSFLMGSPESESERSDNETRRRVTLTKGYWLGVHQVTQAHWRAVLQRKPSKFKGDCLPVERVSWDECQQFCLTMGEQTGRRLRLPTEAEWEHACRAGTTMPFHFGERISTNQANYDGNYTYGSGQKGVYREKTTPVGSFPPNAWGVFDMHGNVWEWCQDRYGNYPSEDITDPQSVNKDTACVLRGGSWSALPRSSRSACRYWAEPCRRSDIYGCRVVLRMD